MLILVRASHDSKVCDIKVHELLTKFSIPVIVVNLEQYKKAIAQLVNLLVSHPVISIETRFEHKPNGEPSHPPNSP